MRKVYVLFFFYFILDNMEDFWMLFWLENNMFYDVTISLVWLCVQMFQCLIKLFFM